MQSLRSLTTPGNLPRATLLVLIASWGCGGSSSEPTKVTPPIQNLPARITVVTAPKTTAEAGSNAGDFVVRVENTAGAGLAGKGVMFGQTSSAGGFVFSPFTATTDSAGLARTTVTYRTAVGSDQLTANVDGLSIPAFVSVTITPAPPAYVVVTPSALTLFGAGDTASFQVNVTDVYSNIRNDVTPVLQASDPTAVSVTPPAAVGGKGTVRALKGGVSVTVDATAPNLKSGKLSVGIYPNPRNVCGGITPQPVSYGVPFAVTDSVVCLPADPYLQRYSLMVYNESTNGTASLGTTVTGTNVTLQLPASATRIATRPSLARLPSLARRSSGPTLDLRFHQRLLERSLSLRRMFGPARMARSFARSGSMGRIRGPSYSLGSASTLPAVDDLVSLNVASDACTTADMRTFRVEAVGDKAIVLADTGNPAGFTRTDYQRFAGRFDQLVYPADVNAFDAPTDIDGNGHVAILFTRAVNELTPANSGAFVGGFFHPRDLFPRTQSGSSSIALCATSNEGEMFYMMVPDPAGIVNGNRFRIGFVDTLTTGILAHEFQHLINAGRRMYVNTSATSFEDVWLNEGLSHEAQELLFFQDTYYNPRLRLGASVIGDTQQHFDEWVADDAPNFENFWLYLSDPANHSPIDLSDDLETRGATWAFLRFAADRAYSNDAVVWKRFVNSTTTGIGTLTFALQTDPQPLLQAFALANMTKSHPSWDFADIYTRIFVGGSYPLPYMGLQEGVAVPVAARGGSASYYQFTILENAQAVLRFGSTAAPADPNLKFVLLRSN